MIYVNIDLFMHTLLYEVCPKNDYLLRNAGERGGTRFITQSRHNKRFISRFTEHWDILL